MKTLKITIIMSMLLLLMSIPAKAALKYGDLTYEINDDNTITITDCSSSAVSVNIPSEIDEIAVTSIGEDAFYACKNLESIIIPDSISNIGGWAFYNCHNLISIKIPDSVTSIGVYTFDNCYKLTSIIVDENNSCYSSLDGVLFNKDKTQLIQYPTGNTRTNYTLPNSVENISMWAFSHCENLENIIISNNVINIGTGTFNNCKNLTNITIGSSVKTIGECAFKDCYNLKNVYIKDISAWCKINFEDGSSNPLSCTENLYINNVLTTDIVIPDTVKIIKNYAFYNCNSLTSITIGNSTKIIGECAFCFCENLTSVTLAKNIIEIKTGAFDGCDKMTTVNYIGNEDEWDEVYIGIYNGSLLSCKVNFIKKTIKLKTDITNNIFIVTPDGMPQDSNIIFTCYKEGLPVYVDVFTYKGNTVVPFVPTVEYDEVKVMAWESLESMYPLCDAQKVVTSEPISLLTIE